VSTTGLNCARPAKGCLILPNCVPSGDGRHGPWRNHDADLDTVEDFYFGPMSQVQASIWSKGRFVLLGDAAYCPTPFTGEGTALALVGAYVLAGEIKRSANFTEAFAGYESFVRPYVEASQKRLSPGFVRLLHAKSSFGIALTHLVQKIAASEAVQKRMKLGAAKRDKAVAEVFVLPRYS
jgi:2-polyprenyl-6-methoxyphenol hydroxylase-like FAD-dependent oxidoreductase